MSKKIPIDSELFKDLLEGDFLPVKVWYERRREGRKLLEECKDKNFSILEWHGFDETPENGKVILMLWNDGTIDTVYPSDEWPALKSVRAWAYLPE